TGFYYIAKGADIPLVLCKFDWGNKEVVFDKPFYTTDDEKKDFERIYAYFKGVKGKNPELGVD
ncbi:MAG TPA: acyltransferase, partial [Saprospiraceae bacterium]|nr:acyltransferase [Saprospiraceae bacterium]